MSNGKKNSSLFIKLRKSSAQEFLNLVKRDFKKIPIINRKLKLLHEYDNILFPLIKDDHAIELLKKTIGTELEYDIIEKKGTFNSKFKYKSLIDALKGEINEEFLDLIPKSFDIIGDIAIVEINNTMMLKEKEYAILKKKIANAIILVNKNIKSIYAKRSKIKGSYRLRELEYILGEEKTITTHKENDCVFKLDLSQVFFSPRLVFERKRIASCDFQEKEIIVDLFAGVGPFSIQIAKNHNVTIYSFDVNSRAYEQLKENIALNKIKGEIFAHNMDVKTLVAPTNELGVKLKNKVDRVIMNLPEKSIEFIDIACFLMKKSGGIIHSYQFNDKPNAVEKAINNLQESIANQKWAVKKIINSKIVKHFSPKVELIGVDLEIIPLE